MWRRTRDVNRRWNDDKNKNRPIPNENRGLGTGRRRSWNDERRCSANCVRENVRCGLRSSGADKIFDDVNKNVYTGSWCPIIGPPDTVYTRAHIRANNCRVRRSLPTHVLCRCPSRLARSLSFPLSLDGYPISPRLHSPLSIIPWYYPLEIWTFNLGSYNNLDWKNIIFCTYNMRIYWFTIYTWYI